MMGKPAYDDRDHRMARLWALVMFLAALATLGMAVWDHLAARAGGPLLPDPPPGHEAWRETQWSQWLARQMGGQSEYRLPDQSRVDVLTDQVAWEVEWSDKWPESIGQAKFYAHSTDREPGVVLLLRGPRAEEDYLEALVVIVGERHSGPFRLVTVRADK